MEAKKPKLRINSYILYKADGEWHEGRITNIVSSEEKETYHVFSFATLCVLIFESDDLLSAAAPELRRRMKAPVFADVPNKIHFPARLLNVLIADRECTADNLYDLPAGSATAPSKKVTVAAVIGAFGDFLLHSSGAGDSDEILEVCHGLITTFDAFLPNFLLYTGELDQGRSMQGPPSETYGPVHLLRLVYFLQCRGKTYISDGLTASILADYTVYLLDFLLMKYSDYF